MPIKHPVTNTLTNSLTNFLRLSRWSRLVVPVSLSTAALSDIPVKAIHGNLSENPYKESLWEGAEESVISLMAQPMVAPRPKVTETSSIKVAAIHDNKWIAFKLSWTDTEVSESGKLATFSDAVALEFPILDNENPPPIMMGFKDNPVHIFHWRYTYQLDAERGMKTIDKIYPNMTTDMYPLDYKVRGNFKESTPDEKDAFLGGKAAGNPQSYPKAGVDEIFAEGFGSSAVIQNPESMGRGTWKANEWTVIIARPLIHEGGSKLQVGKSSNVGFAVWQGGKNEVGARKSLTMTWTPIHLETGTEKSGVKK
jgi:Ethylbenzene dehydrogenase